MDLGYDTNGASSGLQCAFHELEFFGPYTLDFDGYCTAINLYTIDGEAGITAGIYTDNNGVPGTLVAATQAVYSADHDWTNFTFVNKVHLVPGSYWIACNTDSVWGCAYQTSGSHWRYATGVNYVQGSLPSSAPTTTQKNLYKVSAYATVLKKDYVSTVNFGPRGSVIDVHKKPGFTTAPLIASITYQNNSYVNLIASIFSAACCNLNASIIPTKPQSPRNILAIHLGGGSVMLTWDKPLKTNVAAYVIQRSLSLNGPYITCNGSRVNKNSAVVHNLPINQNAYFRVATIDVAGVQSPFVQCLRGTSNRPILMSLATSIANSRVNSGSVFCSDKVADSRIVGATPLTNLVF